jgi:hypothetical protein
MLVYVCVNAQTSPTVVSTDGTIQDAYNKYIWGTVADTLTDADTLTFVYRIKARSNSGQTQDFAIKLYNDRVSGTAGGTLVAYSSPDGVNYITTTDTITVSGLSADAMDSEVITLDNFMQPYLKFIYLQTGTAVTIPKVYVYSKKN